MAGVPKDIADALKENGLDDFFSDCTASHRREYLNWIAGAKRPETRTKRIAQAMKMIRARQAAESARAKKNSRAG